MEKKPSSFQELIMKISYAKVKNLETSYKKRKIYASKSQITNSEIIKVYLSRFSLLT